jgi:hypothetical protein
MKNIYRHGDISLHPTKEVKGERVKHNGAFVLAEGETTGHKHVLRVPNVDDMEIFKTPEGGYYMRLKSEGTITHEEHRKVVVAPGTYKMVNEREYDWFGKATRKVQD